MAVVEHDLVVIGAGAALGPVLGGAAISVSGYSRANLLLSAALFAFAAMAQVALARRRTPEPERVVACDPS